jgi:SAM-dependent methyltransferase
MKNLDSSVISKQAIQDIFTWDIVAWSKAIPWWESKITNGISGSRVLELGAGTNGGLSLWLALRGANVVCSTKGGICQAAKDIHNKYDFPGSIEYADIDATNIPFKEEFDLISFKSILGGIEGGGRNGAKSAVKSIKDALKQSGELVFAENLTSTKLHMYCRDRFNPWNKAWKYYTIEELRNQFIGYSSLELTCSGLLGTFGRNEWQRNLLSKIESTLIPKSLIKDSWRYIAMGIAKK